MSVQPCIALLGGSFDPVHHGHVALARLFCALLRPDELRVLPAKPWQKAALKASDAERVAMLELAFKDSGLPVVIDQVASFVRSVPGMIQEFTRSDIYATLDAQFGDQFQDLVADVQTFLTDPGNIAAIGGGALQVGASIANAISGIIVVLVLTLYFVATLPSIKSGMLRLAPARDRARASDITEQITDPTSGISVMQKATVAMSGGKGRPRNR